MLGIYKAYVTRVGEGPFPTELPPNDAVGDVLLQLGTPWAEVGTTTGRQRRVGWFDAVMGRYAVEVNGIDTLAITKLDVLDTLDRIKICVAYRLGDELIYTPPATMAGFQRIEPVYEEMVGWQTSTRHVRQFQELPPHAQAYVARICELVGARLGIVTVGPEREETIMLQEVF